MRKVGSERYDAITRRATELIRSRYPRIVGIAVDGSVGRGNPGPFSDVDIFAITEGGRTPRNFWYLDAGVLVGIAFTSLKEFRNVPAKPKDFYWSLGGARSTRILYDRKGVLRKIVKNRLKMRTPQKIVELTLRWSYCDALEYAGKLRNGWHSKNEYLTRYAARVIAGASEGAVMALNEIFPLSENTVWHEVMNARKKPSHFGRDYPISSGLKGTADTSLVYRSGMRLASETLQLIRREYGPLVRERNFRTLLDSPLPPGLS